MFSYNLSYEIKLLRRSNWLIILSVSLLLLFVFAIYNGNKNVEKRLYDISVVQEKLHEEDSEMLATLKKIEAGEETNISSRMLPSEPMNIGYRYPRLAIMQPETLSFLATGQSDMYTQFCFRLF